MRYILIGSALSVVLLSAPAAAQWSGFTDRSVELGTDDFSFSGTRPGQVNSNENYYDGDFADFDRDGTMDRALGARYGLLHNTGGGVMTPFAGYTEFLLRGMPGAAGWGEDAFQWADVDGDGDLDNLSGGNGEPLTLQVNAEGRFDVSWQMPVSALNIVNIDLEGDGDIDLAVAHSFCSDPMCGHGCPEEGCDAGVGSWPKAFNLLVNDGSGTFTVVSSTARGLPDAMNLIMGVAAGDVDGDGDHDLVFINGIDRRLNLGRNDGAGNFTTTSIDFGVPVREIGPISSGFHQGMNLGDIDGDGDLDIVAALDRDVGTHPDVGHAIFENDGMGGFTETSATAFDLGGFTGFLRGGNGKLMDADYDGDLDFVAFDRDVGRVDVFLNDGSGVFTYRPDRSVDFGEGSVALGNDTDVADVDGDGSYDLWVGSGGADVRILSNSYRDPLGLPADVPRDLRLVAAATSGIEIEWDAPPFAATARHYRVYRATSAGLHHTDMRWIGTVGNVHQDEGLSQPLADPTPSFTDTTAVPGVGYYYVVTHVGPENDESVPTAELAARITPPGGADTTPPDIDVVSPTQQQWGAAPRVVVHLSDGGSGVDVSTLSVRFDAPLGGAGGRPAGADITDLAYRSDAGVFIAPIPQSLALPIDTLVTMTVSVEDAAGNMASTDASFFVAETSASPPTADFDATPTSGDAPLTVALDATATSDGDGKILRWEWYFGDGTTSLGRVATHDYLAGGTYSLMLRAVDDDGGVSTSTQEITVAGAPPECTTGETRSCYTGPAGTAGVGACVEGVQSCVSGAWSACGGEVGPAAEICDNGIDDDCDGAADAMDPDGCGTMGGDGGAGGDGGTSTDGGRADGGGGGDGGGDGCGCRTSRGPSPVPSAVLFALVTAVAARRRRRRR